MRVDVCLDVCFSPLAHAAGNESVPLKCVMILIPNYSTHIL